MIAVNDTELREIEAEVDKIGKEMEWRNYDLETSWWQSAYERLDYLCNILEFNLRIKRRRHLKIIK